jgi:hypothetical protein
MNEELICLDAREDNCEGEVDYRPAMSPTGKWFPRCEKHLTDRLATQERIVRDYGGQMFY